MNTIPHETDPVKDEVKLTRFDEQHLYRLKGKRDYYKSRNELQPDGSFFQEAKKLWEWLKCTKPGLMKSRKRLIAAGKIKYHAGGGRKKASYYWILDSPQSKPKAPLKSYLRPHKISPDVLKVELRLEGIEIVKQRYLKQGYTEAEFEKAKRVTFDK